MVPAPTHRPELQGLRALAVVLVLIYHIWPQALPGGYVGVDVFFVISGYLICGSLFKQAEQDGSVSLSAFYARRIRRLLPAASVVLAFVFAGALIWLPEARWTDTFIQIAASALYVENWYLAWASVDYLASENSPSPVQHYWSLSIEEQFYLVWPWVMVAALAVARLFKVPLKALVGTLIFLIFAASLAASVVLTASDSQAAYFVSHTRVWELALGGLIAIWLPAFSAVMVVRALLFLAGLAAILASSLLFEASRVAFPGYVALLPTLGTVCIILAGDIRLGLFRGLNYPPLRYLGDVSYSIYLWHWPLIIFYLAAGHEIGLWSGLALMAATLLASHISYAFIEQWFRHPGQPRENRTLAYGVVSVAAISGAAWLAITLADRVPDLTEGLLEAPAIELYPGPNALAKSTAVPEGVPLRPSALKLLQDKSSVYSSGCHQHLDSIVVRTCLFGQTESPFAVAVIGSSHSVNWLPAMDELGRKNGWQVQSMTKSGCAFNMTASEACNQWINNLVEHLAANPVEAVIIGEYSNSSGPEPVRSRIVAERVAKISDLGIKVFLIRPTPHLRRNPADCLPDNIDLCVIPRQQAERTDITELAAKSVPGVVSVNMNDFICSAETCSPVVGNLIVFRDSHHLTATYSRALGPLLETALQRGSPGFFPIRQANTSSAGAPAPPGTAELVCSAIPTSAAFTRQYNLQVDEDQVTLRRGDTANRVEEFETWQGTIRDNRVVIRGEYIEGHAEVRQLEFAGTFVDGLLIAAGRRGPRTCSVTWARPDTAH